MKNSSKKIAFLGLSIALALLLAYVEVLIPPLFTSIPGIKIGLPNIIIMFLLYRFGICRAVTVSLIRILLVAVLFGNPITFVYSIAGAILSLSVMILLRRLDLFSEVGVSVAGGVAHNLGQVLTAMLLLDTAELGYYTVVLTVTGIIAGIFVGICGSLLIKKIPKRIRFFD